MVGLAPVEGTLDDLTDGVDAIERHGEEARGKERDVLVGHREDERRRVREEEGDKVAHLQVLEGYRGCDHPLAGLERGQHELALAVQIKRCALAHVAEPAVVLHDGLDLGHHFVCTILERDARKFSNLLSVPHERPDARHPALILEQQLLITRVWIVQVSKSLLPEHMADETEEQAREPQQLGPLVHEKSASLSHTFHILTVVPGLTLPSVSQERAHTDVKVSQATVQLTDRGLGLVVSVVRKLEPVDNHKRQHRSNHRVRVGRECDGALKRLLHLTATPPQLHQLRHPPDDEREEHLRDDLTVYGLLEAEDVGDESVPSVGELRLRRVSLPQSGRDGGGVVGSTVRSASLNRIFDPRRLIRSLGAEKRVVGCSMRHAGPDG